MYDVLQPQDRKVCFLDDGKRLKFFFVFFFLCLSYDVHTTQHSLVLYLEQQLNMFEMDYKRALMFITPKFTKLKWTNVYFL